jgi:hypothetical protein
MSGPLQVSFEDGRTAAAVRVEQPSDIPGAVAALRLHPPRLVVVLVGGAGHMDADDRDRLRPLFERVLIPEATAARDASCALRRPVGTANRLADCDRRCGQVCEFLSPKCENGGAAA